jgi:hypothetical protein
MKILGHKDGPVSRFSHKKFGFGKFLVISGEMGLIPPKKWTSSLADECLSHRERGSLRLSEPHARRVSARS